PFAGCPDKPADAVRTFAAAQYLPAPIARLRILDLARDTAAVAVRHKNEIAAGETQVRRDPRALRPDRTFRHLHDYVGTDRINARDVFCRDPLFRLPAFRPINFFNAAVQRGRDRVPKMEERIFLEADVDEHRLQSHLDVLNFSLV